MTKTILRAILLMVMGSLCIGGAAVLKHVGFDGGAGLLVLGGVVAFGAAGFVLLFAD